MQSVAAQHAEMGMLIAAAPAFCLISHVLVTPDYALYASKCVPILANNVLKENANILAETY